MRAPQSSRNVIAPHKIAKTVPAASTREPIYVEYLQWLSNAGAKRVLAGLIVSLLVLEGISRTRDWKYSRTAVSSLHGLRAILQQAIEDPTAKTLAFGDSTLLGGGVADPRKTVMGYLMQETGANVYNLAVPSGDCTTAALLLELLTRSKISGVDTILIEILPAKFITFDSQKVYPRSGTDGAIAELQRLIPDLRPATLGLSETPMKLSARAEVRAQWELGNISHAFRHRDWGRTEVVGNYPILWLIGAITPRAILGRLMPEKAAGMNRLGANLQDSPFTSKIKMIGETQTIRFAPEDQTTYLRKSIQLARILGVEPIVLVFPMHTEGLDLTPVQSGRMQEIVNQFEEHVRYVAAENHVKLILCPSADYQSPMLWTRTWAHFNSEGARKIWASMKPELGSASKK